MIHKLKTHFARYGTPTQLISDNGPQFTSDAFRKFPQTWEFDHITSSPGHSQSNGMAESAVKTAKRLLTKTHKAGTDQYIALLDHRNTPSQGLTTSPAQRFLNRRTRTLLPTSNELLKPEIIDDQAKKDLKLKKQAEHYDKTARDLRPLKQGDTVRIKPLFGNRRTWDKAVVQEQIGERSYAVQTPQGTYRRNRVHLRRTPESPPDVPRREAPTTSKAQQTTADTSTNPPA